MNCWMRTLTWSPIATTFLWTFTVCLNELLDTYSDDHWWQQHFCGHLLCAWMTCWIPTVTWSLTATTFQWKVTVCLNELLEVQSDQIPDGNTILVDVYCVKWHRLLTTDENISVDIHSVKRQRQYIWRQKHFSGQSLREMAQITDIWWQHFSGYSVSAFSMAGEMYKSLVAFRQHWWSFFFLFLFIFAKMQMHIAKFCSGCCVYAQRVLELKS